MLKTSNKSYQLKHICASALLRESRTLNDDSYPLIEQLSNVFSVMKFASVKIGSIAQPSQIHGLISYNVQIPVVNYKISNMVAILILTQFYQA